jgi:16S rRNA (guanine1207-N2)-methyltransferase
MVKIELNNIKLEFKTSEKVFSPSNIDKGTLAMISQVKFNKDDKLLDLGCGYGFVGIYASKLINAQNITMCDISKDSVNLSKFNAKHNSVENLQILQSDALDNILDEKFSLILSNPPYHVDFSVPKKFIEQGYSKLVPGGRMYMVTKRKDWYKNKLISTFGGVKISQIDGYFVFMAEKRSVKSKKKIKNTNTLSKKLQRKNLRKNKD